MGLCNSEEGRPSDPATNQAFVFIKPHAVTEATKAMVKESLQAKGLTIMSEGTLTSEEIDSKKLIDQHYYAIASKATILKPAELNVPADKFEAQFGLTWEDALKSGRVFNAMDGCADLGITADEMDAQWGICKKAKKLIKFGGGFYCGLIEIEGKEKAYVFNGFFMSMRTKFTAPGLSIYYYTVKWDAAKLSWEDFRGKLLGPTDPAEAPADSLRGRILADWEKLGLKEVPNVGDNGVHASASPFEGLAERNNWLGTKLKDDTYGAALLNAGIPESWIKAGCVDPQVALLDGKKGSLFDAVEDLNAKPCLEKLAALAKLK
jgi:nucleoside diphosphate kinase